MKAESSDLQVNLKIEQLSRTLDSAASSLQEFTKEGLAILLGYAKAWSMTSIDFKKLRDMKLITVKNGKWKADLSLLGLTK